MQMSKIRTYIRDGRAPIPRSENTSKVMSAIRGKNTKPEIMIRKALWADGLMGYRLHWKKAPGRPDICYPGRKIAIFVHGCYWHRCPYCKPLLPKSHRIFWQQKFIKNRERDKIKARQLQKIGWRVVTLWGCQIHRRPHVCVEKVKQYMTN